MSLRLITICQCKYLKSKLEERFGILDKYPFLQNLRDLSILVILVIIIIYLEEKRYQSKVLTWEHILTSLKSIVSFTIENE